MDYISSLLTVGLPITLIVTLGSYTIGIVGGIALLLLRRSSIKMIAFLSGIIIDIIRGLPPIVWLFIIFFGLGSGTLSFRLTPLTAALFGMGLVSSGYLSEIFRGGILAVDNGQWQAARALSLSRISVGWDIIWPQAVRNSIPSAATYLIGLFKDTSIVSTIGVSDLSLLANHHAMQSYKALYSFAIVGLVYIAISAATAWFTRRLDRNLRNSIA